MQLKGKRVNNEVKQQGHNVDERVGGTRWLSHTGQTLLNDSKSHWTLILVGIGRGI